MYRVPQQQRMPQRAPVERRTQINFEDAVTTLQTMFGNIDREVIRMILQANQGQMEVTVENLLQMSGPGGYTDDSNAADPASNQNDAQFNASGAAPQSVNLPDDFLRPPSWFRQKYPPPQTDEEAAQELERRLREEQQLDDELFAKVLQNSMFMADLQAHPEWVTESDQQQQQQPPRDKGPSAIAGPPVDPSDTAGRKANFREKLGALSQGARAKLGAFAQRLSRNKSKNSSTQPRRMGGGHYQQITSLDDEPLLDDDDDDVDRPFTDGIELQARGGYKPPKTDDL